MYNYIILVMVAVEQQRDMEANKGKGKKSTAVLPTELYNQVMGTTNLSIPEAGKVTIEVTAEDVARMKAERKKNRPNQ